MDPGLNLFSIVLLLGAAHGLFLALALLHAPTGNVIAHRMLAIIILILALDLGNEFLYQSYYYVQLPYLIWIDDPLEFLYGPLALFYVQAQTSAGNFRLSLDKLWHFVPVVFAAILGIPFYSLNAAAKLEFIYAETIPVGAELALDGQELMVLMFLVQFAAYLILGIRELVLHARRIRDHFSYTERINLVCLRNFYLFLILMYLLFVLIVFSPQSFEISNQANDFLYLLTVVAFYAMGYQGLRQPVIFVRAQHELNEQAQHNDRFDDKAGAAPIEKVDKYKTSALDDNTSQLLLQELLTYMDNERPYLNCKLTLPGLASQIGISTNYLSQVVNEQLNVNFFDFINQYRIDEARQSLADPENYKVNVLTIALNAGFKSKTAFYTAFKKHTGLTPNHYRKSHTQTN